MDLQFTTRVIDSSGQRIESPVSIDPARTAVIIIDPWNFHWCMTTAHRVGALVQRWNRGIGALRRLGMQVMWAPTEAASQYAGWPQRERAAAVIPQAVPQLRAVEIPFTVTRGKCMCGPGIACTWNYGLSAICPGVEIGEHDLIVSGAAESYSICRARGFKHAVYMGLSTNICLSGRPEGIGTMRAAGIEPLVCRDMDDAFTHYEPNRHTPDDGSAQANDDLERAAIRTISAAAELRKLGLWNDAEPVDPVRFAPWGKIDRPYLFEESAAVTLTFPNDPSALIRYTIDGSPPTPQSRRFEGPIACRATTTIRALACRDDQALSLPSEGVFVRLPASPPLPEVYLDQLTAIREDYPHWYSAWHPVMNQSFAREPLRVRETVYSRGIGMRAPANLRFAVRPEFARFVASVGADSGCVLHDAEHYGYDRRPAEDVWDGFGSLVAQVPNLIFRVFLDGELAAQSPTLRMGHEPWRFDLPIPPGTRQINLVANDAGHSSPFNLGDWLNAGFILRQT